MEKQKKAISWIAIILLISVGVLCFGLYKGFSNTTKPTAKTEQNTQNEKTDTTPVSDQQDEEPVVPPLEYSELCRESQFFDGFTIQHTGGSSCDFLHKTIHNNEDVYTIFETASNGMDIHLATTPTADDTHLAIAHFNADKLVSTYVFSNSNETFLCAKWYNKSKDTIAVFSSLKSVENPKSFCRFIKIDKFADLKEKYKANTKTEFAVENVVEIKHNKNGIAFENGYFSNRNYEIRKFYGVANGNIFYYKFDEQDSLHFVSESETKNIKSIEFYIDADEDSLIVAKTKSTATNPIKIEFLNIDYENEFNLLHASKNQFLQLLPVGSDFVIVSKSVNNLILEKFDRNFNLIDSNVIKDCTSGKLQKRKDGFGYILLTKNSFLFVADNMKNLCHMELSKKYNVVDFAKTNSADKNELWFSARNTTTNKIDFYKMVEDRYHLVCSLDNTSINKSSYDFFVENNRLNIIFTYNKPRTDNFNNFGDEDVFYLSKKVS